MTPPTAHKTTQKLKWPFDDPRRARYAEEKAIAHPLLGSLRALLPGSFLMGSPEDEKDRCELETLHSVTLTRPFFVMATPVTQAMWQKVMGDNPSYFKDAADSPRRPVENVSWEDCQTFCAKLTEEARQAGTLPQSLVYRLPTEAEWEYACRAGSQAARYGELDAIAWYKENSGRKTHPVGQKQPNTWGLHDMIGNVWEWCHDWHAYYPAGAVNDPAGPGTGAYRLSRGGSWFFDAWWCRAACRFGFGPGIRHGNLGFRIVLAPSVQPGTRR